MCTYIKIKLLAFIICLSFFQVEARETRLLLFGGGGDQIGKDRSDFELEYRALGRWMMDKPASFKSQIIYGGDNENLNQVDSMYGLKRIPATKEMINQAILNLTNEIKNGTIKKDDQILIYISSHGAENSGEQTHSIALPGSLDEKYSVDHIIPLLKIAREAGVKTAVVDTSCYSGANLALAHKLTCVLAIAPKDMKGKESYANRLSGKFKSAVNLEEVFISSLENLDSIDLPQISTEAGIKTQTELSALNHYLIDGKNFDNFMKKSDSFGPECLPMKALLPDLGPLYKTLENIMVSNPKINSLKKSITEYYAHFNQTKDLRAKIEAAQDKKIEAGSYRVTWLALSEKIAPCDFQDEIKSVSKLLEDANKNPNGTWAKKTIDRYSTVLDNLKSVEKTCPNIIGSEGYKSFVADKKSYEPSLKKMTELARFVFNEQKALYLELYRSYSKENSICKDFIL